MKKHLTIAFVSLAILLLSLVGTLLFLPTSVDSTHDRLAKLEDRSLVEIKLGEHDLVVEVVNTNSSIVQGLSGRTEIGADGMLFVLPASKRQQFWMKDMLFDLDFVWLNQARVVEMHSDVPAPESEEELRLPAIVSPNTPVDLVLELPAGWLENYPVVEGDELRLK